MRNFAICQRFNCALMNLLIFSGTLLRKIRFKWQQTFNATQALARTIITGAESRQKNTYCSGRGLDSLNCVHCAHHPLKMFSQMEAKKSSTWCVIPSISPTKLSGTTSSRAYQLISSPPLFALPIGLVLRGVAFALSDSRYWWIFVIFAQQLLKSGDSWTYVLNGVPLMESVMARLNLRQRIRK